MFSGSLAIEPKGYLKTLAKMCIRDSKYDEAAGHLNWVLKYHQEPLIRAMAIQRLATVQLQQQKYDDAIATLGMNKMCIRDSRCAGKSA